MHHRIESLATRQQLVIAIICDSDLKIIAAGIAHRRLLTVYIPEYFRREAIMEIKRVRHRHQQAFLADHANVLQGHSIGVGQVLRHLLPCIRRQGSQMRRSRPRQCRSNGTPMHIHIADTVLPIGIPYHVLEIMEMVPYLRAEQGIQLVLGRFSVIVPGLVTAADLVGLSYTALTA